MNLIKYNQRLLAIIGTMVLVGFGTGLIGLLIAGIVQLLPDGRDFDRRTEGVVIDKNRVVDTTLTSFVQNISIEKPYQLDSARPVFLIPIGQRDNRTSKNKIQQGGLSFNYASKGYKYESYSGLYNNFVFIDYDRGIRMPIFKTKIAITDWAYMEIDSAQLILFQATDKDLNNDGQLNSSDFQDLFVFEIRDQELRKFSFDHQTVMSFEPLNKTSKLYVRTGIDMNRDKEFYSNEEPTDLYFYDVITGESESLIPEKTKKEIQNILSN